WPPIPGDRRAPGRRRASRPVWRPVRKRQRRKRGGVVRAWPRTLLHVTCGVDAGCRIDLRWPPLRGAPFAARPAPPVPPPAIPRLLAPAERSRRPPAPGSDRPRPGAARPSLVPPALARARRLLAAVQG